MAKESRKEELKRLRQEYGDLKKESKFYTQVYAPYGFAVPAELNNKAFQAEQRIQALYNKPIYRFLGTADRVMKKLDKQITKEYPAYFDQRVPQEMEKLKKNLTEVGVKRIIGLKPEEAEKGQVSRQDYNRFLDAEKKRTEIALDNLTGDSEKTKAMIKEIEEKADFIKVLNT